jgi:tetratricopeptide (TPR) repeat protein
MSAPYPIPVRLLGVALLAGPLLAAVPTGAGDAPAPAASILDDATFTARLAPALDRLYDLDLAAAEAELAALAALYPEHPAGPLLGALADWWRVMLDTDDTAHDAALEARIDEVLARADARLEADRDDPDGLFFRAAAIALRGRLASLRGRWIPAAHDGGRALRLVRRLAAAQPDNRDLLFGLGAYDYCADVVPERYPIFKPLVPFFPRGDRERGLAALEEVRDRGRFARAEAAWLLAQLHYLFERDRAGTLEQLGWLRERYPGNALFHAFEGRTHVRFDDCARGGEIYRQVLDRAEAGATGYNEARALEAHYMLGRCALENGRYQAATPHLSEAARLAAERPDSPYRTLAHLRLGMAADALGDRAAAVRHYRTALAFPDTSEAHRRARGYLREPYEG